MIKVVVADDHAVVRTGLQLFFQASGKIKIDSEASNGNELLEMLKTKNFDVAVIDLNMPGKDSLDLIGEIRNSYPKLPIVILTMNADDQLIMRLFKMGINAFINKEESPDEIQKAIIIAAQGQKYISPQQKNLFANQFLTGDEEASHQKLTDREYQIMLLLTSGLSHSEISQKLAISKNTLSNHRNHILKKIGVSNIAELTKYVIKKQLIS